MIHVAHERPLPRAVLFDFDGTLADTAGRWVEAYNACLAKRGRRLDDATRRALAGASVSNAAEQLGIPRAELREALVEVFASRPVIEMPGAIGLVAALVGRTRLAVASNGPLELVKLGLSQLDIEASFDAIVSAETTGIYKPSPDVYLRAAAAVQTAPAECVAVEDSDAGLRAAVATGARVIFVSADEAFRADAGLQVHRLDDPRVKMHLCAEWSETRTVL